jgi:hypothetical protein
MARVVRASQREVIIFCDCPGCPSSAAISDVDGMSLCAECLIEYWEKGKLIAKTKYDEDGEPYMEDDDPYEEAVKCPSLRRKIVKL